VGPPEGNGQSDAAWLFRTQQSATGLVVLVGCAWFRPFSLRAVSVPMYLAGVKLEPSQAWLLAQKLHQAGQVELAVDIASAVNANHSQILLTFDERRLVLAILERDCPVDLQPLRDALWSRINRRAI
jgi:hypothetical protein